MATGFHGFYVIIGTIFLVIYVLFVFIWINLGANGILDLKLLLGIGILLMFGYFFFKVSIGGALML